MPTWTPFWPQTRGAGDGIPPAASLAFPAAWDPAGAWELQTQLLNQLMELSRSFWSIYAMPLQGMPWLLNTAPPLAAAEVLAEPAAASDAASDVLETQTRLWNHFLDAHRSFWTSYTWPIAESPVAANEEAAPVEPATPHARKPTAKRAKPVAVKTKAARAR